MGKQYSKTHREALLKFARSSIAAKLGRAGELPDEKIAHLSPVLMEEKRGVFVTLHKKGNLRGCIGNIEPVKSVREGIRENSEHAAFRDTRFSPLTPEELDEIDIEVSILTDPERVRYREARDLVSKLTPNVDGVILKKGHQRATFLPQVWEQLDDPDDFLSHLCVKAGLKGDEWKKGELEVYVYQVESFEESKRS
ncbi:AmmeMemoRadiSam system protein A [Desulfospira joergensenii]|uniref:AmmeMemoRadiSam system protein A n=1 Tax=Desulfospira joergensenii TaxID=53329 RepID=UPI000428ED71|nr:AmmeMemoRadiSam system protein A [Desulfospira joergensenii]